MKITINATEQLVLDAAMRGMLPIDDLDNIFQTIYNLFKKDPGTPVFAIFKVLKGTVDKADTIWHKKEVELSELVEKYVIGTLMTINDFVKETGACTNPDSKDNYFEVSFAEISAKGYVIRLPGEYNYSINNYGFICDPKTGMWMRMSDAISKL